MDIRNTTGGLSRFTSIPGSSTFAQHGGAGQPCSFTANTEGTTSDGQPFVPGQVVISGRWLFVEGTAVSYDSEPSAANSRGPLATATRAFFVFCDSVAHAIGFVVVPASDTMLDPHVRLTNLYNALQLEQPVVYRNPVVDKWGGLITRFPAWLAIGPSAWRPQSSNAVRYRGWLLHLLTEPSGLQFQVTFTPDPAQPSPPFSGIVPCVAGAASVTADTLAFPAMPELPEQTAPGVNGACMWTPPGPGTVTIQARITYHVTFWANGFTEVQPDYVWTSPPAAFATGELAAVNTND